MALHPDAKAYLVRATGEPHWAEIGITAARARRAARNGWPDPREPVAEIRELTIDGPVGEIPLRLYMPSGPSPRFVVVYLHGGGWVLGNLDQVDAVCRMLANHIPAIVVSVDYHLAPEYRFRTAADEAYRVLRWAAEVAPGSGSGEARLVVAGDSSGANLAIAAAFMSVDLKAPRLEAMILAYPPCSPRLDTPSYRSYGVGYGLTAADMRWFWSQYLAHDDDLNHPYAVPLVRASYHGLPPTLMITAQYDPLRDENDELVAGLHRDGVWVSAACFPGMVHGFFVSAWAPAHRRAAVQWVSDGLRSLVAMAPGAQDT